MEPVASRPKFGTDGWRAIIGEDFNIYNCLIIVKSLLETIKEESLSFAIGYDTRFLSKDIAKIISNYLAYMGMKVILSDRPVPTPVTSFTVKNLGLDYGLIITASHNSSKWNGIKIKNSAGQSIDDENIELLSSAINNVFLSEKEVSLLSSLEPQDGVSIKKFLPEYIDSIKKFIDLKKIQNSNLNIIVDCMHGTSSLIMTELINGGNSKIKELNNESNPEFPGIKQPEPIDENLTLLKKTVTDLNADLGFGFDADSDRVGVIDDSGIYQDAPYTFCTIAEHILGTRNEKKSISTTISMTSNIDKVAKKYGVDCFRTKIGFKYVAPSMQENQSILGGEESGGFSYSPHLNERDGIISALLILEKISTSKLKTSEIFHKEYEGYGNLKFKRKDIELNDEVKNKYSLFISNFRANSLKTSKILSFDSTDGLKIHFEDNQWILIRLSGTEPLVRIYAESTNEKKLLSWISDINELAISEDY